MNQRTPTYRIALFSVFSISLVFSQTAYAYLDPGTGSMIVQAIVAGILGGIFAIKFYWQKLLTFFRKDSSNKPE